MLSTSYTHPVATAHAVGGNRATRWIVSVVCGLLLTLASAVTAHAATPAAHRASVDGVAAACTTVAIDHTRAPRSHELLDGQPSRDSGSQCPLDSSDSWLEPDDDDDEAAHGGSSSGSSQLSADEVLGLRSPSASAESVMPDARPPVTQFLTDSVRRM